MFTRVMKHITWPVKIVSGPSEDWDTSSYIESSSFLLSKSEERDEAHCIYYNFGISFNYPEPGDISLYPIARQGAHDPEIPKLLRLTVQVLDQVHGKDDMIETMKCKVGETNPAHDSDYYSLVLKNVTLPGSRFVKDEQVLLVLIYSDPDQDDVDAEMETESEPNSSAQSNRMLANEMQEKATRRVDIKEFSAAAMRAFLSFINVGTVESLGTIDKELYELVYQLEKLKLLCSKSLVSRVTNSDHASEILQFAVLHDELFDRCFITLACFYPTEERLLNFVEKHLSYELQAKVFKTLFLKSGGLGHDQIFIKIQN